MSNAPVAPTPQDGGLRPRSFALLNAALSAVALAILAYVLVLRPRDAATAATGLDLRFLPAVNATLNATASALIIAAVWAIRTGQRALHRRLMLSALGCSVLFLVGYLAYHYVHGDTRYPGEGAARTAYLFILASHVVLSITVVPLVLTTLWLSLSGRFATHRKVARVTFPIWLYVSVTGVLIFFMLRGATPALP